MSRRTSCLLLLLLTVFAIAAWRIHGRLRPGKPVNLLLITMDTTRADRLGCYGCDRQLTPAIDRIAARGTLFEQCRTVAPITLPSHATILTGLRPPSHGLRVNAQGSLPADITTLSELFRRKGATTAAFVASMILDSKYGLNKGFDVYDDNMKTDTPRDVVNASPMEGATPLAPGMSRGAMTDATTRLRLRLRRGTARIPPGERIGDGGRHAVGAGNEPQADASPVTPPHLPANTVADRAISWLKGIPPEKPFFCWVHFYDPHFPYISHPDLKERTASDNYDAEVAFMDMHIERLVACLKTRGLARKTMVVLVADHGEGLYDHGEPTHGMLLYDTTMRVPLIVCAPGTAAQNRRVETPVSTIDIFPTILDVFDLGDIRDDLPGINLLPALRGKTIPSRASYGETDMPVVEYGWAPSRSIVANGWKHIASPVPELFCLENDHEETNNLAARLPQKIAELAVPLSQLEVSSPSAQAGRIALSRADRQQLESLGYAGGLQTVPSDPTGSNTFGSLPDVKDMMPIYRLAYEATGKIVQGDSGDRVLADCRALVEQSPATFKFHNLLARLLAAREDYERSAASYRKALEINPDCAESRANLGSVLVILGKHGEAMVHLDRALELDPSYARIHTDRGIVMLARGDIAEAAASFSRAMEIEPRSPLAHKGIADCLRKKGDIATARDHYESALRFQPGWLEASLPLAWILAASEDSALGNPRRALVLAWDACENTSHTNAAALDVLAAAYAAGGKYDKAVSAATQAIALATSAEDADLAEAIRLRSMLYRQGKPFVESSGSPALE